MQPRPPYSPSCWTCWQGHDGWPLHLHLIQILKIRYPLPLQTTLLDLLAGRKTVGSISGEIRFAGGWASRVKYLR